MVNRVRARQFLKRFRVAVWLYVVFKKFEFSVRSFFSTRQNIGIGTHFARLANELRLTSRRESIFWRDKDWHVINDYIGKRSPLPNMLSKNRFDKRSFFEILEASEKFHFRYKIANRYLGVGSEPKKLGIVISTYGSWDLVHGCLSALQNSAYPIEKIVIVNDNPKTEFPKNLYSVSSNIEIISNPKNLGYLKSTNLGYRSILEYEVERVLLLNDDTFVCPNAIERLNIEMSMNESAAVGLKLLNQDWSVQEQGSVIFSNGLGENIGGFSRTDDLISPFRRVDYCSAAGLLLDVKHLGEKLFDTTFEPAYYEDTDLCFRLGKELKLPVHASYSAIAIHLRGQSYGSGAEAKSQSRYLQHENRLTFVQKWKYALVRQAGPETDWLERKLLANFSENNRLIVVGDDQLPTPDRDSGSLRMFNLLKCMRMMGYQVAFVPSNGLIDQRVDLLFSLGVFVFKSPSEVARFVSLHDLEVSGTLLSRPGTFQKMYPDFISSFGDKKVVYDMVDWHEGRIRSEIESGNTNYGEKDLEKNIKAEQYALTSADQVMALNEEEATVASKHTKAKPLILGNILFPINYPKLEKKYGLIFVGSAQHPPNFHGLDWFFKEIWPLVPEKIRHLKMRVVGFDGSQFNSPIGLQDVHFTSFVEDSSSEVAQSLVSVAPLLSGAGVKGKVVEAILCKVPLVITEVAAQGLDLIDGSSAHICTSPRSFAENIEKVILDKEHGNSLAEEALNYNFNLFSDEAPKRVLADLFA